MKVDVSIDEGKIQIMEKNGPFVYLSLTADEAIELGRILINYGKVLK